jgi:hypothetical protein
MTMPQLLSTASPRVDLAAALKTVALKIGGSFTAE